MVAMDIVLWLLIVEFLGLLAFPFTYTLLPVLKDRGYGLAKPLGLLMLAYPVWLLGSLNLSAGTTVMPVMILVSLTVAAALVAQRRWSQLVDFFRREKALILLIESIFLLFFLGFVLLKAGTSAITHTEQPMDFAFLNAAMLASSFPPEDPWLAGNGISYYYLGYLIFGLPGVIGGLSSSVVYNLALALIPSMAAAGMITLISTLLVRTGASLKLATCFGVAGAFLLVVVGNLEGLFEMIHAWGLGTNAFWEWIGIKGLMTQSIGSSLFSEESWWWWRSSRIIDTVVFGSSLDFTIQEYPFFSIYLGDLHPHVMSIPFVLLFLAFCLQLLFETAPLTVGWIRQRWFSVIMVSLTLGALGFINAWDLPVFLVLLLGVVLLNLYRSLRMNWSLDYAIGALALIVIVFIFTVVPFLPYYVSLSDQLKAIEVVSSTGTRLLHMVTVWGLFFGALIPFIVINLLQWREKWQGRGPFALAITLAFSPFLLWLLISLIRGETNQIPGRLLVVVPLSLVLTVFLVVTIQSVVNRNNLSLTFTAGVLAIGVALLIGSELFYVVDVFDSRMNTVFKLYYQTWILLAVAIPVAIYYWAQTAQRQSLWMRRGGMCWATVLVILSLGALYLPIGMVVTVGNTATGPYTLNGIAFLKESSPGEFAAIEWLRSNATVDDGIVEAVGSDYTEYGRVASFTGIPTVLNWPGHELQWRGSSDLVDGIAEDVSIIYQSEDVHLVSQILDRYNIQYVIFGERESDKYQVQSIGHLSPILAEAFSQEGFTIYKVPGDDA
mgnify:CR=1 FL=1